MTHPKEAVEAVARALRDAHGSPPWATWGVEATALLDQIAPMLTARAEADAREAALQYLSDTGQMMDRIAAMEADKAAAVDGMREAAAEVADGYDGEGMNGGMDCHLGDAYQTRRDIAAAIRALAPPPAARGQEVEALVQAAKRGLNYIANTEGEMGETLACGDSLRAALAPFTGGKA